MKFTKSSRILAIALAVVMILPLISVMAFAEGETEETSNVLFKADFESYELTDGKFAMDAADSTFTAAPNGAGCKWNETSEAYTSSGNYVVADPTLAEGAEVTNKVFVQDVHENLDNNNTKLAVPAVSYATTPNITFTYKIYIPTGTVGKTQSQWFVGNSTTGKADWCYTHYVDFNGENPYLDLSNAQMGTFEDAPKEARYIPRDTWVTITWALDMVTGDCAWYINGNEAAVGNFGRGNVEFTNRLHIAKPLKSNNDKSTYTGNIYYDDFAVIGEKYTGEVLWSADFDSFELTDGKYAIADADANGPIWKKNPNSGKTVDVAKIVADPAGVEGNQVYAFNNWGGTAEQGVSQQANKKGDPDTNWDNNNNMFNVPAVSYETHKAITWSFDIYVPKDATGSLLWQWAGSGTTAAGADSGSKTWNDFLYIQYTAGDDNAFVKLFTNNLADDSNATVMNSIKKETWTNIAVSWDLVKGELTVYVGGKQAFRGYYVIQSNGHCTNLKLNEGGMYGPKLEKTTDCKGGKNAGWTYFDNMTITVGKKIRQDIKVVYPEGTFYMQDFNGYKADQNVDKNQADTFIVNSKVVEAHKIVADPKDDKNLVWYRPLDAKGGANDDPWACMGNERAAYAERRFADLTVDYYLPTDATGYFQVQLYGSHSGSTGAYMHLWDLNVTDGLFAEHYDGTAPFTAKNEEAWKLARDTWYTVRTIIDLEVGSYDVFINGVYAASGHILGGAKNIIISKNYLDVCCLRCSQGATNYPEGTPLFVQSGYVLVDNVNFKEFTGSIVKVTANGLADGVIGTKVNDKVLEAGVHVFDTVVTPVDETFDKAPYAKLFKSTVGEFRVNEAEGIRFVSEIDADLLAKLLADTNTSDALVKKGTIILPKDYVTEGVEVTFEGLAGIDYLDVTYEDLTAEYDTNKIAGSMTNIKATNMNREFIAVPYVQVTLPHGNTLTIYGEASEAVTVAKLAVDALADTTASFNGTEKALLEEYAAKLKAE